MDWPIGYDGAEIRGVGRERGEQLLAVVSCTAFEPSTHVRCNRACLARDVSSLELPRPS